MTDDQQTDDRTTDPKRVLPGAEPVRDGMDREWGGYSGYFGDPDGFRWEVAWNPGPIGQEVLP